jgi:hypothetical protein
VAPARLDRWDRFVSARAGRATAALALAALLASSTGCFNPFDPRISVERVSSTPAPVPNTPANVVKLFEWCWLNRDAAQYREVFTDDYRFQFAPNDSAGGPYQGRPWIREDELASASHLFQGGTDRPPASRIQISLEQSLLALPDPRPGKNKRWHKSIRSSVELTVTVDQNGAPDVSTISGYALFFLVRGDSAAIPSELGFRPDSTRWWIERWEDETAGATGSPSALRPAGPDGATRAVAGRTMRLITFGRLKTLFR